MVLFIHLNNIINIFILIFIYVLISIFLARMMQDCQPGWKPGMPCSQKATKQLGSKSDLETKKLLKFLGMGVGIAGACVVVWLAFRHFTGQTNGGIPEPETKLPEGKIPTHVQAIMDHKAKMKAEGKEYPEDSD